MKDKQETAPQKFRKKPVVIEAVTNLAPIYIAEQIFFYVLLNGGKGNPFSSMSSQWFSKLAAVKIRELLTSAAVPVEEATEWINEDELPEGYPYHAMFPRSKLGQDGLGGVRIFPKVVEEATEREEFEKNKSACRDAWIQFLVENPMRGGGTERFVFESGWQARAALDRKARGDQK